MGGNGQRQGQNAVVPPATAAIFLVVTIRPGADGDTRTAVTGGLFFVPTIDFLEDLAG